MEDIRKILTPQDYEEALLRILPEEVDRLLKQWEEFALQKRPFFNMNTGTEGIAFGDSQRGCLTKESLASAAWWMT